MSPPHAADAAARAQASDPAVSVLLEAPAGSGKTAVLTQRFLRLLCTVEDAGRDPRDHLHAQGGRRNARARHPGAARPARRMPIPPPRELRALAAAALAHGAARGWRLLEEPQSLRIQTIDSFNYWLASQLPRGLRRRRGAHGDGCGRGALSARRAAHARERGNRHNARRQTRSCCSSVSTITG